MPTFQFSHGNLKSIEINSLMLYLKLSVQFSSVDNSTDVQSFQSPIRYFPIFNIQAELLTWGNLNLIHSKHNNLNLTDGLIHEAHPQLNRQLV